MSIIRKEFVRQVLQEEGKRFHRNQGREIHKKLHFHTRRLINQREVSVSTDADMDGQLSIKVPHYNRLLDLRKNTRKKGEKGRERKGYRIYNRFAYGHYYGIAFRLQYDLTDEVQLAIRRQWQKGGFASGR